MTDRRACSRVKKGMQPGQNTEGGPGRAHTNAAGSMRRRGAQRVRAAAPRARAAGAYMHT